MRRTYYDKKLKIFIFGMFVGTVELALFLYIKKYIGEGVAWAIHAGLLGMVCAAWGMSNLLRKIHRIDEEEAGVDVQKIPVILPHQSLVTYEVTPGAVTFPYVTKALHAASAAASTFWVDYDPDRPPLQKTVQSFLVEQGIPVRQAVELASAIKPDSMSEVPDTQA
ncbi:hypothetical protein D3C77_397870 [compost metagenome]